MTCNLPPVHNVFIVIGYERFGKIEIIEENNDQFLLRAKPIPKFLLISILYESFNVIMTHAELSTITRYNFIDRLLKRWDYPGKEQCGNNSEYPCF